MVIVWLTFTITAALLAGGAWVALRHKGEQATAFRNVARFLFAMAVGTALFPTLLPLLGVKIWVGGYITFIVLLTVIMTFTAVTKARQTA